MHGLDVRLDRIKTCGKACKKNMDYPGTAWPYFFTFGGALGPVRNAPERSWHASGAIFMASSWQAVGHCLQKNC